MPPTSSIRKTNTTTATASHVFDGSSAPRRTTSGRAVRSNTTRPTNYYARPFASYGAAAAANNADDLQDENPGFYPAIQYFTDSITALPKEVMRQYTLVKEVEGKIYGSNERIGEMIDALMLRPVPPRNGKQHTLNGRQGILSLTANNSTSGSTNASLINGIAPNAGQHSAHNSIAGSLNGEDLTVLESDEDVLRRKQYLEFRMQLHNSLANLDEKNGLLAGVNRVLAQQLSRIDSVLPHVDNEISEEARLGSMAHWAYSDNRQKRLPGDTAANRRNVAATHSLAAAASVIHENEILQTRRDAVREVTRDKAKGRGRDLDSDFDDKPRKTHAKVAKSRIAAQANNPGGSSMSNGEAVKKRRVDKGMAAPIMERSISAAAKGGRTAKEAGGSQLAEPSKKAVKARPGPPPKRKGINSAQASPALASSPLQSTFTTFGADAPGLARPQSARARQNSTATNLRHESLPDNKAAPLSTSGSRSNGDRVNGKRKAPHDAKEPIATTEHVAKSTEPPDDSRKDHTDMADAERPQVSRSTSNSGKAGRGSKSGTPRNENFPDAPSMLRTRSARSIRTNGGDDSSSEPHGPPQTKHRRVVSNSHLVKQLAPFNRSPDLDRHIKEGEEDGEGMEVDRDLWSNQSPRRRPQSRRNTTANSPPTIANLPAAVQSQEPENQLERPVDERTVPAYSPEQSPPSLAQEVDPPVVAAESADAEDEDIELEDEVEGEEEEEDEGSEPGDPDDPNEQKYCYCNRGSYGEMVACDNEACPREWFHLGCTELKQAPDEEDTWYCAECRPLFVRPRKVGRSGRTGR